MKKKRHVGLSAYRLKRDQNNPRGSYVCQKVVRGKQTKLVPGYTDRDEQVAATIVQWFGSNVGIAFLAEVAEANPKIAEWFKRAVTKFERATY